MHAEHHNGLFSSGCHELKIRNVNKGCAARTACTGVHGPQQGQIGDDGRFTVENLLAVYQREGWEAFRIFVFYASFTRSFFPRRFFLVAIRFFLGRVNGHHIFANVVPIFSHIEDITSVKCAMLTFFDLSIRYKVWTGYMM